MLCRNHQFLLFSRKNQTVFLFYRSQERCLYKGECYIAAADLKEQNVPEGKGFA